MIDQMHVMYAFFVNYREYQLCCAPILSFQNLSDFLDKWFTEGLGPC